MSLIPSNYSGVELAAPPLTNSRRGISLDLALSVAILLLSVARLFPNIVATAPAPPAVEEPSLEERIAEAVQKGIKKAAAVVAEKEAKVLANLKAALEVKKKAMNDASTALEMEQKRLTSLQDKLCPVIAPGSTTRRWKDNADVQVQNKEAEGMADFVKMKSDANKAYVDMMKVIEHQEVIVAQTARAAEPTIVLEDVE